MSPPKPDPAHQLHEAIRRVERPIRSEWPKGGRFFVSPPLLFGLMLLLTVLAFFVMYVRFRQRYIGY